MLRFVEGAKEERSVAALPPQVKEKADPNEVAKGDDQPSETLEIQAESDSQS